MTKLKDGDPEKWILREHTKIKHAILSRYLTPWTKILSSFNRRLVIIDGFAGRGQYLDEASNRSVYDGSPIILMDLSIQPIVDELVCICIEKDPSNYDNLCRVLYEKKSKGIGPNDTYVDFSNVEITKYSYEQIKSDPFNIINHISSSYISRSRRIKSNYQRTRIFVIKGEFEKVLQHILSALGTRDISLAPSFYFVDPFGFHGIPFQLIRNILALSYTEVLLTFMVKDIKRFNPLPQEEESLKVLFNSEDWRKEMDQGRREIDFVNYYKSILKRNGIKFVIFFRIDETSRRSTLYYLIHASNNLKAVDLMKGNMKNINPDFTYYGPDNEKLSMNQARLTFENHPLTNQLRSMFKGKSLSFSDIRSQTIDSNSFVEKEYREIIKSMEKEGKVQVKRIESKRTGIKNNDLITFL